MRHLCVLLKYTSEQSMRSQGALEAEGLSEQMLKLMMMDVYMETVEWSGEACVDSTFSIVSRNLICKFTGTISLISKQGDTLRVAISDFKCLSFVALWGIVG